MSRTLLAIISSGKDNALVERHWPFFKMTGWQIVGFGTEDKLTTWPEDIEHFHNGKMGIKQTPAGPSIFGLVEQELAIWSYFLEHHEFTDVAVVEADNLFVRKPPAHPCNGLYLVTALPNYSQVFQTPVYFSTPRWADRQTVQQLHAYGRKMFKNKDTEFDVSDRFPSLICHRHKIPWLNQPAWSPSAFVWQAKGWEEAWHRDMRAAVKMGCYALHSVKTVWQLEAVKTAMKESGLQWPEQSL